MAPFWANASHHLEVGQGLEEGDGGHPVGVVGRVGHRRRLHPGHDVGTGQGGGRIGSHRHPGVAVPLVGEAGRIPGPALQGDIDPRLDQPGRDLGNHGHPRFTRARLPHHGQIHGKRYTANPSSGSSRWPTAATGTSVAAG